MLLYSFTWTSISWWGIHSKTLTHLWLKCGQYRFTIKHVPVLWTLVTHSGRFIPGKLVKSVQFHMLNVFAGFHLAPPSFSTHLRVRPDMAWHRPALPHAAPDLLWVRAHTAAHTALPTAYILRTFLLSSSPFLQTFLTWGLFPAGWLVGLSGIFNLTQLLMCWNDQKYFTFQRQIIF